MSLPVYFDHIKAFNFSTTLFVILKQAIFDKLLSCLFLAVTYVT